MREFSVERSIRMAEHDRTESLNIALFRKLGGLGV
jgi:hypothetical protein